MEVREFKLVNEKGQEYSLMDIKNYALLTEPTGLGVEFYTEYEQLGNTFVENLKKVQQGKIRSQVNFLKYDNYKKLIDFIAYSKKLMISYKIPFENGIKEYFKEVSLQILGKTEKNTNGVISEEIVLDCLSLWYEQTNVVYKIGAEDDEIRWDYKWDSKFASNDIRNLKYINQGHVDATIYLEIDGNILNPSIELYIEGELYQTVEIHTSIQKYEKIVYSSKENEFEISKINTDGTKESLFDLDIINFENDNVVRIPPNKSCEIRLRADNNISGARLSIYVYYIAV